MRRLFFGIYNDLASWQMLALYWLNVHALIMAKNKGVFDAQTGEFKRLS